MNATDLRNQAQQIREAARHADSGEAMRQEMAYAARLEAQADDIEGRAPSAVQARGERPRRPEQLRPATVCNTVSEAVDAMARILGQVTGGKSG